MRDERMTDRDGAAVVADRRQRATVVDGDRLWKRLQALAAIGRSDEPGGGIHRAAYGADHARAARLVAGWMRDAGLQVGMDAAGSLIGTLPGTRPELPALALGSHLDTVPHGGAFDGALGVLAALEAVQTLAQSGEPLERSLVVIGFADEEGNAFSIGVLSAQLWIGEVTLEDAASIVDRDGRTLADTLAAYRIDEVPRIERPSLAGYLEAHVEQGPVLDASGASAAAVEAIVGIARSTVTIVGEANHAGTTPMRSRKDAAWPAADIVTAVRSMALATDERLVATVGVVEVHPGATNVVPGRSTLRIEVRSADDAALDRFMRDVEALAARLAASYAMSIDVGPWHLAPPVPMDPMMTDAVRGAIADAGEEVRSMPSWAGHDAKVMARSVPVGMVFVPSVGGVSHAPGEVTLEEHCVLAAEILLHAAKRVASALGDA